MDQGNFRCNNGNRRVGYGGAGTEGLPTVLSTDGSFRLLQIQHPAEAAADPAGMTTARESISRPALANSGDRL